MSSRQDFMLMSSLRSVRRVVVKGTSVLLENGSNKQTMVKDTSPFLGNSTQSDFKFPIISLSVE